MTASVLAAALVARRRRAAFRAQEIADYKETVAPFMQEIAEKFDRGEITADDFKAYADGDMSSEELRSLDRRANR